MMIMTLTPSHRTPGIDGEERGPFSGPTQTHCIRNPGVEHSKPVTSTILTQLKCANLSVGAEDS